MKDGFCPKCNEKEIHFYLNTAAEMSIKLGFFDSAGLIYYICTNCGYVELFVEDTDKLPLIAEKHPRVY